MGKVRVTILLLLFFSKKSFSLRSIAKVPYFGVACSEPLHGLRAGARRNAQPRKIQQAEGPGPGVFQRPLFSRTPKTDSRTTMTPWGRCKGPDLLRPATPLGHLPARQSLLKKAVDCESSVPAAFWKVRSFHILKYEALKPYLISLVNLGDCFVSMGEGPC